MLKRLLRRTRDYMQAEMIATMRALHDDQKQHIQALHDDVFKQLHMIYNQQIKSNEIISRELGAAAKSIEAGLLTITLHSDETGHRNAEELSSDI